MPDDQNRKIIKAEGGFFGDIFTYLRLVLRLMGDSRVNSLLKVIPIASLVYLLFPLDVPGPIDDLAVVGLGLYTFVELSPQDVVDEHRLAIEGIAPRQNEFTSSDQPGIRDEDVIDAEYREE
jgi:uncharacterized membrane protein YkvA (DUF1232 family)